MKFFSVLALAVAFMASSAEAGCRGNLFGGRLRGGSCGSSCATSCSSSCGGKVLGGRLLHGKSCGSSSCSAGGCTVAEPAKAGSEKPKAAAPSTK